MNAAVRAVVRTALDKGAEIYAVFEGYQGLVEGGARIRKMDWDSVGGILQQGGTIIGTARSEEFRTREGRRTAALNLVRLGIDGLIVIGGDGSLTGANLFRREWPELLAELSQSNQIDAETVTKHPNLIIVGMVGSIDNDFSGTEMTIGADSALHRITDAVDAITSTAASHQRTFIVKVMGRNCGYLALYGALATGADWVLIPEAPPDVDNWQDVMVERLKAGTRAGRRDHIVIMAEGAQDRYGNYIGSSDVQRVLEEGLGEEVRTTVLGHVQRGGRPIVGRIVGAHGREVGRIALLASEQELAHGREVVRRQLRERAQLAGAVALPGSIERGLVKVGDEVELVGIKPTRKIVVTGVEMFKKLLDEGQAGDNVGCLLRGIERDEIERGQVLAKPGTIKPGTQFKAEVYVLSKEEGGRHTPFYAGYRPQFYLRTTDVTGAIKLPAGVEMIMPGDNVNIDVELITPIAIEQGQRFAIREGGHTVGAGVITEVVG